MPVLRSTNTSSHSHNARFLCPSPSIIRSGAKTTHSSCPTAPRENAPHHPLLRSTRPRSRPRLPRPRPPRPRHPPSLARRPRWVVPTLARPGPLPSPSARCGTPTTQSTTLAHHRLRARPSHRCCQTTANSRCPLTWAAPLVWRRMHLAVVITITDVAADAAVAISGGRAVVGARRPSSQTRCPSTHVRTGGLTSRTHLRRRLQRQRRHCPPLPAAAAAMAQDVDVDRADAGARRRPLCQVTSTSHTITSSNTDIISSMPMDSTARISMRPRRHHDRGRPSSPAVEHVVGSVWTRSARR
jgi:hypothetical protein